MSENKFSKIMNMKEKKCNVPSHTFVLIIIPQGNYFSYKTSKRLSKKGAFFKNEKMDICAFFFFTKVHIYLLIKRKKKTDHASICNRFESSFHLMPASKHASYSYKLKLLYHAEYNTYLYH